MCPINLNVSRSADGTTRKQAQPGGGVAKASHNFDARSLFQHNEPHINCEIPSSSWLGRDYESVHNGKYLIEPVPN